MPTHDYDAILNADVQDSQGERLGAVNQLFLDDQTQNPSWVTVATGLFGRREYFIPLADAEFTDGAVRVPYAKSQITSAPNLDVDQHLSRNDEDVLFDYYNVQGRGGMPAEREPGAIGEAPSDELDQPDAAESSDELDQPGDAESSARRAFDSDDRDGTPDADIAAASADPSPTDPSDEDDDELESQTTVLRPQPHAAGQDAFTSDEPADGLQDQTVLREPADEPQWSEPQDAAPQGPAETPAEQGPDTGLGTAAAVGAGGLAAGAAASGAWGNNDDREPELVETGEPPTEPLVLDDDAELAEPEVAEDFSGDDELVIEPEVVDQTPIPAVAVEDDRLEPAPFDTSESVAGVEPATSTEDPESDTGGPTTSFEDPGSDTEDTVDRTVIGPADAYASTEPDLDTDPDVTEPVPVPAGPHLGEPDAAEPALDESPESVPTGSPADTGFDPGTATSENVVPGPTTPGAGGPAPDPFRSDPPSSAGLHRPGTGSGPNPTRSNLARFEDGLGKAQVGATRVARFLLGEAERWAGRANTRLDELERQGRLPGQRRRRR